MTNLSQVSENTHGQVATLFLPPPSEHRRSNKASILALSRQHMHLWRPVNIGLNVLFAGHVCFWALENKTNYQLWDFCEREIFPKRKKRWLSHTPSAFPLPPLFFRPSGKSRSPLVPPAFALFPSPTAQINGRERDLLKAVRECRSQQPGHSARPTPWPPLFRGHL